MPASQEALEKGKVFLTQPTGEGSVSYHHNLIHTTISSNNGEFSVRVLAQIGQPGAYRSLAQFILNHQDDPTGHLVSAGYLTPEGTRIIFGILERPHQQAGFAEALVDLGKISGARSYLVPSKIWRPEEVVGDELTDAIIASANQDLSAWQFYVQHSRHLPTKTAAKLASALGI